MVLNGQELPISADFLIQWLDELDDAPDTPTADERQDLAGLSVESALQLVGRGHELMQETATGAQKMRVTRPRAANGGDWAEGGFRYDLANAPGQQKIYTSTLDYSPLSRR